MRPHNPKYATARPINVVASFHCDNVGFTVSSTTHAETGQPVHVVRIHGKRYGKQRVANITPEDLSAELWEYLGRLISS